MAASMTLDLGNTDKLAHFRQELAARHRAVAARHQPLRRDFSVEDDPKTAAAIRYALAAVKGVGAQAMQRARRRARGATAVPRPVRFRRPARHPQLQPAAVRGLVKAGAFDGLDPNRAQSFAAADLLLRHASRTAEERESRRRTCSRDRSRRCRAAVLPVVADWPPVEKLQHEFDAIGFYLSSHPLDPYGRSLERAGILRWVDLPAALAASG